MRSFIYKLFRFEFWPWWALFIPLLPVYFYAVLYTRKWLYFTAVNPKIDMGGFFGERKSEIMALVPAAYKCKELLLKKGQSLNPEMLKAAGLEFPLFVKPNVGERGFEVKEVHEWSDLESYASKGFDFVVQEKLHQAMELGVLFHKTKHGGKISSLVIKEFMQLEGDGSSSISELIAAHSRYFIYLKALKKDYPLLLQEVPTRGEQRIVHRIGNHSKGTVFKNGAKYINHNMRQNFARMFDQIEGLDYGRFDVKTQSLLDFEQGRFKVFELNGVSADPGHIYDLSQVFLAYKELYKHWLVLAELAKSNIKKGVKTTPLKSFLSQVYHHFFA